MDKKNVQNETVLRKWNAVLANGKVDGTMLDTSFFDLGGHSLMVAKVQPVYNNKKVKIH